MADPTPCTDCGEEEHYIHTERHANRFGVTGLVVESVECTNCGKETSV